MGWTLASSAGAGAALQLRVAADTVGAFGKVEFAIGGLADYPNPFDPALVDLRVVLTGPGGGQVEVPAFFAQEYERRRDGQGGAPRDWVYPVGTGAWKARFAPPVVGTYSAVAVLIDQSRESRSTPVAFRCVASGAKGFIRVARMAPAFFEFDNGEPFFAIGQNLAFIGEQQYVKLPKAEEIFGRLAENGANYLRVWTCADDWALAIEARKSAWERSWEGKSRLVPQPDDPARKCLLMTSNSETREVNPSHPVALRAATRYVVTGKVRTEAATVLRLEVHGTSPPPLASAHPLAWTEFRHEFTTGTRDWQLGAMRFRLEGKGSAWLVDVSLQEAAGGAELLWEAAMNRPARGFYNPLDCFLLDELLAAAERRGIYLQLCMLTRDLYMKSLTDASSVEYDGAIADAKKFFRHAIARWGYSTSVAAWEYWNEMNPGLPTERFYTELGGFLEKADPYRHLRTTSTWGPSAKDCRHPQLDVADVHFYLRPADKGRLANEVEAVIERTRWLRAQVSNKPIHLGEFGLADDNWRVTEDMKRSGDLSDMHNVLWASALSGASGSALLWWWERIDQRGGYTVYRPLSRFIADVPWNSGDLQQLGVTCKDATLRVLGLSAGKRAWLWLFDPAAAWAKVASEQPPPPVRRDAIVELPGWPTATARAEWWDTRSGEVTPGEVVKSANGMLRLRIPPFQRDIACRLVAE